MPPINVFVLGAGAIGSYFGSQLSKVANVTLVARRSHFDAVNVNGLKVSGEINETFWVDCATELTLTPSGSIILVTTKTYDLEEVLRMNRHLFKDDVTLVLLQNGHGNEEITRRIVGSEVDIVRGLVNTGVNFLAPGSIEVKLSNPTVIENSPAGRRIASLFLSCGLAVILSDDMQSEVWRKLVLNCVINPLTALYRVPNREIAVETLRGVINSVVDECRKVAEVEGVHLDQGFGEYVYDLTAQYGNLSSMCQDIIKGKQTEIEFLNGRVSDLGKRYGVDTPVNDTLAALIRYLEGQR